MKIWITTLISMTNLGCSVGDPAVPSADPVVEVGSPPQREARAELRDDDDHLENYAEFCGRYDPIKIDVDGGYFIFRVPLPCDPLWKLKDRGDPPFEEQ